MSMSMSLADRRGLTPGPASTMCTSFLALPNAERDGTRKSQHSAPASQHFRIADDKLRKNCR